MSAYIAEDRETVYTPYCEECEWEGETTLEESDAKREMEFHNETCPDGDEEPDHRTPRQKYQDELEALAIAALASLP